MIAVVVLYTVNCVLAGLVGACVFGVSPWWALPLVFGLVGLVVSWAVLGAIR